MAISFTYWESGNQPEFDQIANGQPLSASEALVIAALKQIEILEQIGSTLKQLEYDVSSIKGDVAEIKARQV